MSMKSVASSDDCDAIFSSDEEVEQVETHEEIVEEPKVGMLFDTDDEAFLYYSRYAKSKGFGVARKYSKKYPDGGKRHVTFQCCKGGKHKSTTTNPVKPRPQTKTGCQARLNLGRYSDGKWKLNSVYLEHNHEFTPGNFKFYRSNRVIAESVKRKLVLNDRSGIRLCKTYESLQIEAGGHENLCYLEKDCRNYLYNWRRSLIVKGDAEAMQSYFKRMSVDNMDFFYRMDVDEIGRLRNVFWADARSRVACKEFGDVVTFDTTYLVNTYGMPFAPFVGVNHHGQSILLGCGLISHEDTESFSWLFRTWMECMWDCPPPAIITDQCMAMKNAIQEVFPNSHHRWCIWHIMNKVSIKLGGYGAFESISNSMHNVVYDSLTIEEFEIGWDAFIDEYKLEDNEWLMGLYSERKRWVPAFAKDIFWAGMSSTQRSESMNRYFDGYIHSRTTLKQFVEQYENALARKVEKERMEDIKSSESYIPTIVKVEVEKQFQRVYTNAKVKEFQDQFVGKLACMCIEKISDDIFSQYEVVESVTYGQEERTKNASFLVNFHHETNEASCNCRLFEFRGMVCKHQLMVWSQKGVQKVPDKYILRRWRKDVKRAHTKVRINYANSFRTIEAIRNDNVCNKAAKIADLVEDSEEKYDMTMTVLEKLEEQLSGMSTIPSSEGGTQTKIILDPERLRRKGRPRTNRKQGLAEKIRKKKIEKTKKSKDIANKALPDKRKKQQRKDKKSTDVANEVSPDLNDQAFWTQQSYPIHMEPFMFGT